MGIKTIGYPLVRQTGEISPESAIKIYGLFGIQFEILAHIFSVVHFFSVMILPTRLCGKWADAGV